ncbi:MAG: DUF3341 domain-containing protein [Labilithrix sp.]|nr:DUF3341 domain-containing protein [Labilithrix sp.]MCW5816088.1 DUF3341 domain-containing protein [Labilithrix sp.]
MKKAIIGTVQNKAQADAVVTQLRNAGFENKDISVIFPAPDGEHVMKSRIDDKGGQETKAADGAIAGTGAGAVFGGSLGLLAGIGALAIPGLGPFIAAGPIVATLTGLAAGATVGGFTGALIGLGVPEDQARQYETHIRGGGALIAVHGENEEEQRKARDMLIAIGASRVAVTPEPLSDRDPISTQR